MTESHYTKLEELRDKGWYIKFEVNLVLKGFNCMIYNQKQAEEGRIDKLSFWNTPEDGIDWLHSWKLKK